MKTAIPTLPQFSGYPVKQNGSAKAPLQKFIITLSGKQKKLETIVSIQPEANDPANWDAEWFGNYE
jgi:hypothetical protein